MRLVTQAADAIERTVETLDHGGQIAAGVVLAAAGAGISWLAMRALGRGLERPAACPPPPFAAIPARFHPVARAIAWLMLRLGHGPPRSFRPTLLPLSVLVLFAGLMLGQQLAGAPTLDEGATDPSASLRVFAVACSVGAAGLLLFLWAWTSQLGDGIRDVGLELRGAALALLLALGLYLAWAPVQLGAIALESGVFGAFGGEPPRQQSVAAFAVDPSLHRNVALLAGIVLGAPLYEELLFRGILQRFLRRLLPEAAAVVVTAALFTLPHDGGHLPVFALGLALSWLMARTGNLLAPLLFHVLHNGLVLFLIATTART
jgi:membrane protease YdiL (CAAX protease family)